MGLFGGGKKTPFDEELEYEVISQRNMGNIKKDNFQIFFDSLSLDNWAIFGVSQGLLRKNEKFSVEVNFKNLFKGTQIKSLELKHINNDFKKFFETEFTKNGYNDSDARILIKTITKTNKAILAFHTKITIGMENGRRESRGVFYVEGGLLVIKNLVKHFYKNPQSIKAFLKKLGWKNHNEASVENNNLDETSAQSDFMEKVEILKIALPKNWVEQVKG